MKLRLVGRANLVREWSKRLALLGFTGRLHDAREVGCLRWYGEIDDARAALPDLRQLELPHTETKRRARARGVIGRSLAHGGPQDSDEAEATARAWAELAPRTKGKGKPAAKRAAAKER